MSIVGTQYALSLRPDGTLDVTLRAPKDPLPDPPKESGGGYCLIGLDWPDPKLRTRILKAFGIQ